ncbi:acyl carrier protein [Brevibacillus antibioticus]|uniref:Acyl carrier protein n=1 Tax=Brevibacillus antibioticus TaxID=2570228 RepID=A0A4U2Y3U9_9BACL|nr:acyl carrier protein [Brevibacillus antibioticus]TKI55089.1 acyl carrier protein [Brevibacillus antibioticus]
MTTPELTDLINAKIKELFHYDRVIQPQENLNALGLDSKRALELLVALETELNVMVDDEDLVVENFATIEAIANMFSQKFQIQ